MLRTPELREPEMPMSQEPSRKHAKDFTPPFPGISLLFNLGYFCFSLGYLPIFLKKIRQAEDQGRLCRERLGIFSQEFKIKIAGAPVVWVHAVSVGEVMAIRKFLQDFRKTLPEYHVVLTTVTPTGQRIAKEMEDSRLTALYFPFDYSWVCRRFLKTLQPQMLLLAETEIWPNLLLQAAKQQVPVGIMNARLSEKSERRYRRFRGFFGALFSGLDFVLAQDVLDAERFKRLGVPESRVQVLGNMKFDNVSLSEVDAQRVLSLKQEWGFSADDRIWVAGSTHPGEEEVLIQVFLQERQKFQNLKLLVAPRHIERAEAILAQCRQSGLLPVLASHRDCGEPFDVMVLNQLGVLKMIYQIADAVYVGGSLVSKGGQNPIEPAGFKKPVMHGPYVFNFDKIYRDLDQQGAGLLVRDAGDLAAVLQKSLEDSVGFHELGQRAYNVVASLQGATRKHLDWVAGLLKQESQERIQDVQNSKKLFPPPGGGV